LSAFSNAVNELNNTLLMITGSGTNEKNAHFISLHTASPGTTGANEVAGGTYARVATTWGAISAASVTGSQVTINVPAATTITHWGIWDAGSAGNYYDGGLLPASQTYSSAGTYLLTPTLTASL
jgi:hypothetical protein